MGQDDYFARWLDRTMANKGISGKHLASQAHLDESAVSRWRRGRGRPSIDSCELLADALGVQPVRLLVTVGLLSERVAGAARLPMPAPDAEREQVRRHIRHMGGVSDHVRQRLLDAYEAAVREEDEREATGAP